MVTYVFLDEAVIDNQAGEYVAKLWQSMPGRPMDETVREVVEDVWQKTRTNKPIV